MAPFDASRWMQSRNTGVRIGPQYQANIPELSYHQVPAGVNKPLVTGSKQVGSGVALRNDQSHKKKHRSTINFADSTGNNVSSNTGKNVNMCDRYGESAVSEYTKNPNVSIVSTCNKKLTYRDAVINTDVNDSIIDGVKSYAARTEVARSVLANSSAHEEIEVRDKTPITSPSAVKTIVKDDGEGLDHPSNPQGVLTNGTPVAMGAENPTGADCSVGAKVLEDSCTGVEDILYPETNGDRAEEMSAEARDAQGEKDEALGSRISEEGDVLQCDRLDYMQDGTSNSACDAQKKRRIA